MNTEHNGTMPTPAHVRRLIAELNAAGYEVRPIASSPPADDVREALADVITREIYGLRETAEALAVAILDTFEVRPYGTVTDTERPYSESVDIEFGAWETDDIEERAHDLLAVVAFRRFAEAREAHS